MDIDKECFWVYHPDDIIFLFFCSSIMGGMIFQTEKNQVGFVTRESDRKKIGYSIKNDIFRWLRVDDDAVKKLNSLYSQYKSAEFADEIMDLLSDHKRGVTYIN